METLYKFFFPCIFLGALFGLFKLEKFLEEREQQKINSLPKCERLDYLIENSFVHKKDFVAIKEIYVNLGQCN